ncbi:MAG: IS4 family transposase [Verrucomicrobia bacterium]|nr:IS4 family transposase [Verrucomicrobiota bacterium]MDA1069500.1 IS4 family transposase [Verrucomicrobiota bacterium]
MQKLERFLPGFNHVLCGKAPKTTFTQFREKLVELRRSTLSELACVFADFIPLEKLSAKAKGSHSRRRVYTLNVTFWSFLHQVLSPSMPCREVVRKVQGFCSENNQPLPSSSDVAYCKARAKIKDSDLDDIHSQVCEKVGQRVLRDQLWKNRTVRVIDGTGITLPDTPENQAEFPQPSVQRKGCGFPVMQVVACFCLASGALLKWVETELKRHESRILREFIGFFRPGDVVLTDRGFSSYGNLASLFTEGIDAVMRMHQMRKPDYRQGKALGPMDRLVTWAKPKCPEGWDGDHWAGLPATMALRIVRIRVEVKGFRVRRYDLVTTLLDAETHTSADLAELYFRRWSVELFFRHIKTTMGMEMLRCKTPEMIRKELRMFIIAHNLIRALMQEAAGMYQCDLTRMSFKATVDTLRQFSPAIHAAKDTPKTRSRIIDEMLLVIASETVPLRENRSEPRAVKKRPKPFPRLTKHRSVYTVPKSRRHKGKYKSKKVVKTA